MFSSYPTVNEKYHNQMVLKNGHDLFAFYYRTVLFFLFWGKIDEVNTYNFKQNSLHFYLSLNSTSRLQMKSKSWSVHFFTAEI